jgi:hypothetical protein
MPSRSTTLSRTAAVIGALVGLLAIVAAGAGVFLRGDLATISFTTVRGEVVDTVSSGLYRFNGLTVASEGVGWDIVTLFFVTPALLLVTPGVWRGGLRARLAATGLLAYFAYQYLEYAMFLAYGPLFLVYVAIFGLALSGLAVMAGTFDLATVASSFTARFPRRAVVGLGAFMALLLTGMWLPMILASWDQAVVEPLDGATTLVVQALDLGLLVPLGIFTAILVWQRMSAGYVLASLVVVKAVAMPSAIVAMLLVEARTTGELAVAPIAVFSATAVAAAAIGWRVYGSIRPTLSTGPAEVARRLGATAEA